MTANAEAHAVGDPVTVGPTGWTTAAPASVSEYAEAAVSSVMFVPGTMVTESLMVGTDPVDQEPGLLHKPVEPLLGVGAFVTWLPVMTARLPSVIE